HRSFMLNLNSITRIEPYERDSYLVYLKNGEKLPVSKSGYARLRQVLGL
ncbi:MAG TPA: DNA-binding response regulator, partial [Algoriphagus sp.]